MNTLVKKLIVGAAALVLAAAPLAASAQNWHGGGDRGGYRDQRGYDSHWQAPRYRDDRGRWAYARPVYTQPYVNGYFGFAPGGFQGYYYNGGWYHHRRWSGGIWIYF